MTDKEKIRTRLEAKVSQGSFLAQLIGAARKSSTHVQKDFVDNLTDIGARLRQLLETNGLIVGVTYNPAEFWPSLRGNRYCFIDGGVANIDLPSAAPLGIRVGSYMVRPGVEGEEREAFDVTLTLIDELYSADAWVFGDAFDDIAKLRDAARIIAEASAALRISRRNQDLSGIFVHGPIVNPASPYGLGDFPAFSPEAYRHLIDDGNAGVEEDDRKFVAAYLRLLELIGQAETDIIGVVERSLGSSTLVIEALFKKIDLTPKAERHLREDMRAYQLNDARMFDVVLNPGEYVAPVEVNRQGPENKWPDYWKSHIRAYPRPVTTYLKPSEATEPFRIETLKLGARHAQNMAVLLHTSRLLPSYGFPVGLDIVDKYAKVPAWMSRSVRGQHAVVLLRQALDSGDPKVLAFAKRVLAARGRDWLFRPKA